MNFSAQNGVFNKYCQLLGRRFMVTPTGVCPVLGRWWEHWLLKCEDYVTMILPLGSCKWCNPTDGVKQADCNCERLFGEQSTPSSFVF